MLGIEGFVKILFGASVNDMVVKNCTHMHLMRTCAVDNRAIVIHASVLYMYEYVFKHIEAETKWPPFPRRHFQVHFLEPKCMHFD